MWNNTIVNKTEINALLSTNNLNCNFLNFIIQHKCAEYRAHRHMAGAIDKSMF